MIISEHTNQEEYLKISNLIKQGKTLIELLDKRLYPDFNSDDIFEIIISLNTKKEGWDSNQSLNTQNNKSLITEPSTHLRNDFDDIDEKLDYTNLLCVKPHNRYLKINNNK